MPDPQNTPERAAADTFKQRYKEQITPEIETDLRRWNKPQVTDERVRDIKKVLRNVWGLPENAEIKLSYDDNGSAIPAGGLISGGLKRASDQETLISFHYDNSVGTFKIFSGAQRFLVTPENATEVFNKVADSTIAAEKRVRARLSGTTVPTFNGKVQLPTDVDLDVGFKMMSNQAKEELGTLWTEIGKTTRNFDDKFPVRERSSLHKQSLSIFAMSKGTVRLGEIRGSLVIEASGELSDGQKVTAFAKFDGPNLVSGEVKVVK